MGIITSVSFITRSIELGVAAMIHEYFMKPSLWSRVCISSQSGCDTGDLPALSADIAAHCIFAAF